MQNLDVLIREQLVIEAETERKIQGMVCGEFYYNSTNSVKTGREGGCYQYECGHCPNCYNKEAKEDQHNFNVAIMEKGHLKVGIVTKSEAPRFVSLLGKDNMKKYPQGYTPDGEPIYLIVASFNYDELKNEDRQTAMDIRNEWNTWQKAPDIKELEQIVQDSKEMDGFRESGALDKKYTKEDLDDKKVVVSAEEETENQERTFGLGAHVLRFADEEGKTAPQKVVTHAWRLATAQTADLNPTTAEEQQKAYEKRKNLFVSIMISQGYTLAHQSPRSIILKESEIGWDMEYAQKIKGIYSYFLSDPETSFKRLLNGTLRLPKQH